MSGRHQIYNLKVDASWRIAIPSEARELRHISAGDTVIVIEDDAGLHIKSRAISSWERFKQPSQRRSRAVCCCFPTK